MKKILLIEDDAVFSDRLKRNLETDGYIVTIASNGKDGLSNLVNTYFDMIVTDIKMPGMSGIDVIKTIRKREYTGIDPDIPIVVLTSLNSVETAVEAMKSGAADYITKESEKKEILLRVRKSLEQSVILNENRLLKDQLEHNTEFSDLIGESDAVKKIKYEIADIASGDISVLIQGETGVGKELVARAIHKLSKRKNNTFIDINCAALPDENLLQSEFFGHEKGAFTDAKELKKGKFELASGGTLFLDEIAELPRDSQGKLLKVIENQTITRLGGVKNISVDCRYIFATNKDLKKEVEAGRFREDLYYRINVFPLFIPALRNRRQDIPTLVIYFLSKFCEKYRKISRAVSDDAMKVLTDYPWNGNVRELRNVLERLVIRSKADIISVEDIRECGIGQESIMTSFNIDIPDEGIRLEEIEKSIVIKALEKCEWNQKKAAGLLGISVDQMFNRVKKFNIRHTSWHVHK